MSYERSLARAHARRLDRARRRRLVVGTAGALALGAVPAQAAPFTVTNLTDGGAGSLRQAVLDANAAAGADTISFAPGVSGEIAVASVMTVSEDLEIVGPGRDVLALDGGDATRIFSVTASDFTLSGITLRDGAGGMDNGGALATAGGSLTLDDVAVRSSTADRGGGVFVGGNALHISDTVLEGNTASYSGGGLAVDGFSGPAADDEIVISDTVVTGNVATRTGGGISLYDSYVPVEVVRATVTGNTITGTPSGFDDGAGIWFEDTYDGHPTSVRDSTIAGNTGADGGGGISFGENFYGTSEVVNTTVTQNSAAQGGGIQFADIEGAEPFTLRNSTVTDNTASVRGGGVLRGYASGAFPHESPLTVTGSVVADNTAPDGADIGTHTLASGDLELGRSLVRDTSGVTFTEDPAGSVLSGVAPLLGPLAANGGPTSTRLPLAGSPLLDAGDADGLSTDQRGLARTVDLAGVANLLGGDGTDIGAAEYVPPPPAPPAVVVPPPPVVTAAASDPPRCNGVSMSFEAVLAGDRVRFNGIALKRFAGRTVEIRSGDTVVTSGPIRADGTFALSAAAPAKARRKETRYVAVSGNLRTRTFRLERRTLIVRADGRSLSGRVSVKQALRRGATAQLFREDSCTAGRKVANLRLKADGTFSAQVARPANDFAMYRVRVKLRGLTTFSAPTFVRP